jgi:SRSO17 transposase
MEENYEVRKEQLLDECTVAPQVFDRVMPRLERFMEPFVACLVRREQVEHASTFVQGLLSDLDHKNAESIAYRFGQERMPLQWFVGVSDWNDEPLRDELAQQVGRQLGEEEGVIVFDPSAFPKSGRQSVGVAKQWCGRLGKVENCQVAVFMGYVSSQEHALVDTRLYLPREWTQDKARCEGSLREGGRAQGSPTSSHAASVVSGNAGGARRKAAARMDRWRRRVGASLRISPPFGSDEGTLLAGRALQHVDPRPRRAPARILRPRTPTEASLATRRCVGSRDEPEWTEIDVRDGAKGPLVVEALKRRVVGRTHRRQEGHPEILVIVRYRDRDNTKVVKTDYYLSNASADTSLEQFTRVTKAEHRIEECIRRSKSEAGLADYEVRNWKGWHHHQTLSLIATWFLVTEARRGKKLDAGDHRSSNPPRPLVDPARTTPHPKRTRSPLSLETT